MRPKKYNTPHRSRVVKTRMTMRNIKTSPPVLRPTIWAKQSLSGKPYELWGTYPTLLREFVEKIIVHECSYDENGTRRQDIEIYYSFVGKVDLPEA